MSNFTPTVLEYIGLADFVQYMLDSHAPPSTMFVCSTKEAFMKQLHSATIERSTTRATNVQGNHKPASEVSSDMEMDTIRMHAQSWTVPTLRLLASSRTVKLAFCPDVTHLRAYLATYAHRLLNDTENDRLSYQPIETAPILAIFNPIQLHRSTSAFSAQGLNRTLSIAVEAAFQSRSHLILAECPPNAEKTDVDDLLVSEGEELQDDSTTGSPWDEEASILNVTTKTFGAGERGWVGRTVKIRAIAQRWCKFRNWSGDGA